MDDLVAFLRARLDEDERDAKERRGIFPSPGVNDDGSVCLHVRPGGNMVITWYRHPTEGWDDMAKLRSWADTSNGWTQERVLAEVEAKRRLIDDVLLYEAKIDSEWGCCHNADEIASGECEEISPSEVPALRLLALPYADQPGYREEWRP